MEWLHLCVNLRASGMPLPAIRQYAHLIRQGAGNEEDLLALLRRHRGEVTTQIEQPTENLDPINHRIAHYADQLARATTGPIRCAPAATDA
ncbi:MerR family DNA-binding protein [Nonomuraea diastatica]|uniref:MerR family DNA-binding protein n=1 Tax=Nonomuraea diastatica TaxID=1848329 RepID=UPI0014083B4B|nr:MerR family DNA-binding protein [Nonomuraea diastatica]